MVMFEYRAGRFTVSRTALALSISALGLILLLVFAVTGASTYGQNDDWGMAAIMSGGFGNPGGDYTVPFIGPVLAVTFWFMSGLVPGVGWYGLFVACLAITAIAVLVSLTSETAPEPLGMRFAASAMIGFSAMMWVLLQPTFTVAAVLAGGAAGLLACRSLGNVRPLPPLLLAAILGVLGAWLRFEAAALGILVVLPTMIITTIRNRPTRTNLATLLAVSVVALGVLFGGNWLAGQQQNQDPVWVTYSNWDSARGALFGTPAMAALGGRLEQAGWSELDYQSFINALFLDQQTPSLAEMQQALVVTADTRISLSPSNAVTLISRGVPQIFSGNVLVLPGALMVFGALLLVIFYPNYYAKTGWALLPAVAVQSFWNFLVLALVAGASRVPDRILLPTFFLTVWAALSMSVDNPRRLGTSASDWRKSLAVVGLAICALGVMILGQDSPAGAVRILQTNRADLSWRQTMDQHIAASAAPATYSCLNGGDNQQSPYSGLRSSSVPSLYFGWGVGSPAWRRAAETIGVDPDNLAEAFATNRLAIWCYLPNARVIERYVQQNGYPELHLCDGLLVFRFCQAGGPGTHPSIG